MTSGNLVGKLVDDDFSPSCLNCSHYLNCLSSSEPAHPRFPASWQWGHEAILTSCESKPNGSKLIITSWVGSLELGKEHSECHEYSVAAQALVPLEECHKNYLSLLQKWKQLEKEIEREESLNENSSKVTKLYEALLETESKLEAGIISVIA